ncbi:aminopeptidase [bacterium]|nr:aminopeptidase [bacterium]
MKRRLICICLSLLWFSGCYLIQQGKGQLELRYGQIPITEAEKQEPNPAYRALFREIPRIKAFAEERLLLKKSENYTGYYETAQAGVTFVVTASPRNNLNPHTWWFPIIGSVPYKGYFDEKDARELERELQDQGYDTWVFAAPTYSTLGWFKDPVVTPMLRRGHYYLASTIIHEMTHQTLFVSGQNDFNERLAAFVGQTGALQYFREIQQLNREQLLVLEEKIKKVKQFADTVHQYLPRFQELYDRQQPLVATLKQREILFTELSGEIGRLYPHLPKSRLVFNNARLLQYRRYTPDAPVIRRMWQDSGHDWKRFWELVRAHVEVLQSEKNNRMQTITQLVENNSDWE